MKKKILSLTLIASMMISTSAFAQNLFDTETETESLFTEDSVNSLDSEIDLDNVARAIYKYRVNANNVNVREKASTSSKSLGKMNAGDVVYSSGVPFKNEGTTWLKVKCGSPLTGKTGYIAYMYLTEDTND